VVVEDDEAYFLVFRDLARSLKDVRVEVVWASTYEQGLDALQRHHDVAFIDSWLGSKCGLELMRAAHERGSRAPMILLAEVADRAVDVDAMRAGAADYVVKAELNGPMLERVMRYAISRAKTETVLRERDARLQNTVSLLQATLDATADGILVTDEAGHIVSCNDRFREMWRVPPEVKSGRDFAELHRQRFTELKDPAGFRERVQQIRAQREGETDDVIELTDESVFLRHSRPRRQGDQIVGRVWSFRDVTEQRKLQASLVAADRLASMGALAAGVAHEINNPLTYLIANLNVLAEDLPELLEHVPDARREEVLAMLGDAQQGGAQVRKIVGDLKMFSRTDEATTGPVNLQQVIEFAIKMASNEIRHRARLTQDFCPDLPAVEGNEGKLGQVFLNLLINAAQAIPEGRADRNEIRVVTRTDNVGNVVVEVRDSGEGIAADKLQTIFRPFFTTKPLGSGTGLGLSISLGIVTALGGTLEVESQVGSGTLFRVVLPATTPRRVSTIPPPAEPAHTGERGSVLVVEDDARVAEVIVRLLRTHDDVVCVSSGAQALERIGRGEHYDLVLSDLMMPHMSGMDLHERLKELAPALADTMVFITGGAFTRASREFLDRIPNERLGKPVDSAALRRVVRRLVDAAVVPPELHEEAPSAPG
jgi:signal transduction histidine kinase